MDAVQDTGPAIARHGSLRIHRGEQVCCLAQQQGASTGGVYGEVDERLAGLGVDLLGVEVVQRGRIVAVPVLDQAAALLGGTAESLQVPVTVLSDKTTRQPKQALSAPAGSPAGEYRSTS